MSNATLRTRARQMRRDQTPPEWRLWWRLRRDRHGVRFVRQHVVDTAILDFACRSLKLAIELDGHTHDAEADARRDARLAARGWRVVRLPNAAVTEDLDAVDALIAEAIAARRAELGV